MKFVSYDLNKKVLDVKLLNTVEDVHLSDNSIGSGISKDKLPQPKNQFLDLFHETSAKELKKHKAGEEFDGVAPLELGAKVLSGTVQAKPTVEALTSTISTREFSSLSSPMKRDTRLLQINSKKDTVFTPVGNERNIAEKINNPFGQLEGDVNGRKSINGSITTSRQDGDQYTSIAADKLATNEPLRDDRRDALLPQKTVVQSEHITIGGSQQAVASVVSTDIRTGVSLVESTATLKTLSSEIVRNVEAFTTSNISNQQITIKIRPSNLGEIVIVLNRGETKATTDSLSRSPIDIKMIASHPEVANYLSLVKRDLNQKMGVKSLTILNSVNRNDEKRSFESKEESSLEEMMSLLF